MHERCCTCSETRREPHAARGKCPEWSSLQRCDRTLGYDEVVARDVVRQWSEEEFFADALAPTEDDVPIALDGRVLDSPDKVIAYIDEINRRRVASSADA